MSRYIDADNLERKYMEAEYMDNDTAYEVIAELDNQPTADVRENVRGEWIFDRDGYDFNLPAWRCNKCGAINANIPPEIMTKDSKTDYRPVNPHEFSGSNFCPNCGAEMK